MFVALRFAVPCREFSFAANEPLAGIGSVRSAEPLDVGRVSPPISIHVQRIAVLRFSRQTGAFDRGEHVASVLVWTRARGRDGVE